jgi:hypothetical protein
VQFFIGMADHSPVLLFTGGNIIERLFHIGGEAVLREAEPPGRLTVERDFLAKAWGKR